MTYPSCDNPSFDLSVSFQHFQILKLKPNVQQKLSFLKSPEYISMLVLPVHHDIYALTLRTSMSCLVLLNPNNIYLSYMIL